MNGNLKNLQSLTGKIKSFGIDTTLTKKGMCAESKAVGDALAAKVNISDIIDDLLSVASDKPLSANQGRLLKKLIDEIDPHYAENVLYNDTNVKDALDKVSKAENIAYDSDKSVQGAIDECVRTLGYTKSYNSLDNTATTITKNELTFTVNSDKSVTVVGTPTADTYIIINTYTEKQGNHILSGCPSGGSASGYRLYCYNVSTNLTIDTDLGEGVEFTLDDNLEIGVSILVKSGTVMNHTFYPMIRPADIEDDTYMPYVEDVQTRVDRLYDVEQIKVDKVMAVGTQKTTIHSFTINRKAIVSISCNHQHNVVRPTYIGVEINGYELVSASKTNDGSISTSYSCLVEAGRTFSVVTQASASGNNTVSVWGYVQYLE